MKIIKLFCNILKKFKSKVGLYGLFFLLHLLIEKVMGNIKTGTKLVNIKNIFISFLAKVLL